MPVRGLTSYRGFGHHGGNILGPVEWNGTSHLDEGGVAPCCERHDRGVVDNLLRLNLVGYVPLAKIRCSKSFAVVISTFQTAKKSLNVLQHAFFFVLIVLVTFRHRKEIRPMIFKIWTLTITFRFWTKVHTDSLIRLLVFYLKWRQLLLFLLEKVKMSFTEAKHDETTLKKMNH